MGDKGERPPLTNKEPLQFAESSFTRRKEESQHEGEKGKRRGKWGVSCSPSSPILAWGGKKEKIPAFAACEEGRSLGGEVKCLRAIDPGR